ncbi:MULTISPECIES: hypothetical protein [unclassified Sphingomonas]|uniref:hypothetical protein n=1 Tax=unclassified Sphingomonas TaxID=196159 RepID=UPI00226AEF65|nr:MULTISPECIES: hypothetical protein [unclassified Sphingomonas]
MRSLIPVLIICSMEPGAQATLPRRSTEAIKTLDGFSRCVGKQRSEAIRLLATLPESDEEHRQANRIATSSCLASGMLKFRANLMRGTIAEFILKADRKALRRPEEKYTFDVPAEDILSRAPGGQQAAIALVLFGQCVAHENSMGVKAILGTSVETRAEIEAFRPLTGAMTKCSTANFKVDRFQMRGYLAEGAYREFVAAGPA